MVDTLWPANAAPAYSGRMLRQSLSPMVAGATSTRPLGGRSGVRPGTSKTTVTATSTTWTCGAFAGIADAESSAIAGPYWFAFDAVATGAITPAGATARTDTIWVRVDDPAESDGSSVPVVVRGYTAGPTAPPARSFTIARINVPATGGGSPTVTWVAPYAAAAGASVPFDVLSDLLAWAAQSGQRAHLAEGEGYRRDGSVWQISEPFGIAGGIESVVFPAASSVIINVTFPTGRFSQPPIVNATMQTSPGTVRKVIIQVAGVTTTGCQIIATTGDGSVVGGSPTIQIGWTATQMTDANTEG